MQHIFVLGCERSGSTWLSNVLDAHPAVEFFMEPFADYAKIFPTIPGRNCYPTESDHRFISYIEEMKAGYDALLKFKYPWFYKRGTPLYRQKRDQLLARLLEKGYRKFKRPVPLYLQRYELLHLNRAALPVEQLTRKKKFPTAAVTKELRLNFKTTLLSEVFPGLKVLVIMRHPGAQIASVMRLFNGGSLGELGRNLEHFVTDIKTNSRFEIYSPMINHQDWEGDIETRLVLWWLINYDVLLTDLERLGTVHRVIRHEELSEDPAAQTACMLQFIHLDNSTEVTSFLDYSSSSAKGGDVGNRGVKSVDTRRESAFFYKQAIAAVPEQLMNKIRAVAGNHQAGFHRHIRHYLGRT